MIFAAVCCVLVVPINFYFLIMEFITFLHLASFGERMILNSAQESRKLLSSSIFTAPLCLKLTIRELYIFSIAKSEDNYELLNSFCLLVTLLGICVGKLGLFSTAFS
jgi:ABC-type Na+ efflux pump permease subunit